MERSIPPSGLSLLGLVRHMAVVELNWFRFWLGGEPRPNPRYDDGDEEFDSVDNADGARLRFSTTGGRNATTPARCSRPSGRSTMSEPARPVGTGISVRWTLVPHDRGVRPPQRPRRPPPRVHRRPHRRLSCVPDAGSAAATGPVAWSRRGGCHAEVSDPAELRGARRRRDGEIGRDSKRIIVEHTPEIVWEISHVVADDDGNITTFCIYQAPDEDRSWSTRRCSGDTTSTTCTRSVVRSPRPTSPADWSGPRALPARRPRRRIGCARSSLRDGPS